MQTIQQREEARERLMQETESSMKHKLLTKTHDGQHVLEEKELNNFKLIAQIKGNN
jgi:hypothetical protein